MESIYNNLKGVIVAAFLSSLLFSVGACSDGTDEILVTKREDSLRMNIHPVGCNYVLVSDFMDNKPSQMMLVIDRVIKSWRGGAILGFKEVDRGNVYEGDLNFWWNTEDSTLVASQYNLLSFTYDPKSFDYDEIMRFVNKRSACSINQLALPYKVGADDVIVEPVRLYSCYYDNFRIFEPHNSDFITMDTKCLTQRYAWEFYVKKTDSIARVDAVTVEVDGVPCSVDLRTGAASTEKVIKARNFATLTQLDTFDPGVDTILVTFDVPAILAPGHVKSFGLPEEEVGNMTVRLSICNNKDVTRDWVLRHAMTELDSLDIYDIDTESKRVIKRDDAPVIFKNKISTPILVNLDTINGRRNGKWEIIKK